MKKTVLIILTLFVLQSELKAQFTGFFGAGFTFFPAKSETFQHFFQSYNEYHNSRLEKGFDKDFGTYTGPFVSYKFLIPFSDPGFVIGFDIGLGTMKASNHFENVNGNKRCIDLKMTDFTTKILLGFKFSRFLLAASFGGDYLPASLKVYMEFNDGTVSIGNEYNMNGIYEANRYAGIVGGLLNFNLSDYLALSFTLDCIFKPGSGIWSTPETFNEFNSYRPIMSFPKDLAQYVNHPEDYNNVVYQDMAGIKYSITLNYRFGE